MQDKICFHVQSIAFELENPGIYQQWLLSIAARHEREVDSINYVFCTDDELLELNQSYLDHDYYTDILSFPLNENPLEGDIFISIHRVQENAAAFEVDFDNELARVMAHGLLHFLGFDDHEEEDQVTMRQKESEAIDLLEQLKTSA